MYKFNFIINKFFSILFFPFESFDPFWPLFFLSLLTGILMLLVFKYTSNQQEIRNEKNKIKAHLMEMRLFKDDLAILMSAFMSVLLYNAKFMKHLIKPMLFLIVPMVFLFIHLNLWFGYRPFRIGEAAVLSVKLSDQKTGDLSNVEIEVDEGIIIETPSLRISELREVNWRISAKEPGLHNVMIKASGDTFHKKFIVSEKRFGRVSPRKTVSSFWETIMYPGEKPCDKDSSVKEIAINYPPRQINVFGWRTHWLVVFLILSVVAGFTFKGFFNVEI